MMMKYMKSKNSLLNKNMMLMIFKKNFMKNLVKNPFHLTSPSPWPLTMSMTMLFSAISFISMMGQNKLMMLNILLISVILMTNSFMWWRDINRESSMQGNHSFTMMKMLKMSMIMFICSEIMLFISFFWAFFHSSISPNMEIGMIWPPQKISVFNPMTMPLLNSIILLSSGACITWSHHAFLSNKINQSIKSLFMTISLGILFSICQGMEYYSSKFSMSDSVYGSSFFLTTGFHGIHVIIGTIYLIYSMKSMKSLYNSSYHFISFDLSAWYWHFVDIVWLFVFSLIYWWGSL